MKRSDFWAYQFQKFLQIGKQSGWRAALNRARRVVLTRLQPTRQQPRHNPISYARWKREYPITIPTGTLSYRPRFSILATSPDVASALASQTYSNWEICVAPTLAESLAAAQGDFVVVLSTGDQPEPGLLAVIAGQINKAAYDLLSFDEDSPRGGPWFKPQALSPMLLNSVNYLASAFVYRQFLLACGGFAGDDEWETMRRVVAHQPRAIHIPQVLLHRKDDSNSRRYAGRRVQPASSGGRVSIVIPTKDNVILLRACLQSIFTYTHSTTYEIILVDSGSHDPATHAYYAELAGEPRLKIIQFEGYFNYSAANNLGAAASQGDYLLFLNNDTQVLSADWLDELVNCAEQPSVGVVGAKLVRPDSTIQHAGIVLGLGGHGSHMFDGVADHSLQARETPFGAVDRYRDVSAVTGACMLVRRETFQQVGGFDTDYRLGYNDIALCLHARQAGWRVVYTPYTCLLHHEGATRGLGLPPSDVLRATLEFWPMIAKGDPFFSPNLSLYSRLPAMGHDEMNWAPHLGYILRRFGLISLQSPLDRPPRFMGLPPKVHAQRRAMMITHDLSLSGAPRLLLQLAGMLQAQGWSVEVLAPEAGPLEEEYDRAGIAVCVVEGLLDDARVLAESLVNSSLVIANTILTWRAVHAARALGVPCVWWIQEAEAGQALARFDESIASAFSAANRVMFSSQQNAALYSAFNQAENATVIYTGLPEAAPIAPNGAPSWLKTHENLISIVVVGSLEPRKGQDLLLDALAALPAELRSNVVCYLVGRTLDEAFTNRLHKMVVRLNLPVVFTGEVPPTQVIAILEHTDIFVLPSRDDVFPVSLLEAMRAGKAIVAASVGGVPEMMSPNESGVACGLLFPAGDFAALSVHLAELCRQPEMIDRCGRFARKQFERRFRMEVFDAQFRALLATIVDFSGVC